MCQMGFLHRDISINNVLMLDKPSKRMKFEVRRYDALALKNVARDELVELLLKRMSMDRTSDIISEVERLLGELGTSDMCTGFVIDGDLAVDWRTYLASPKARVVSLCLSSLVSQCPITCCVGHASVHVIVSLIFDIGPQTVYTFAYRRFVFLLLRRTVGGGT